MSSKCFWRSLEKAVVGERVEFDISNEAHDNSEFANSTDEVIAIVKEGMVSGAVSKSEAALMLAARVFDHTSDTLAQSRGITSQSLRKRRQRVERKLEAVAIEA